MHATLVPLLFEGGGRIKKQPGTHSLRMCEVFPYSFCIRTSKLVLLCVKHPPLACWLSLGVYTYYVLHIIIIIYGAID